MEEIDSQFDLAYLRLSSIASKLEFKCLCEFNLQELDTIVWDKLNVQGIYLFEIRITNYMKIFLRGFKILLMSGMTKDIENGLCLTSRQKELEHILSYRLGFHYI